jgi:MFS family permease
MDKEKIKKLGTLLSLYVAQSIPMSFFATVVPVIMRQEHYSLESIGLLQLIKLPWIIKFFWAPLVDNNCHSLKDYKKWIFYSEIFYALVILSCGFFSLQFDFITIVLLMVMAFIGSATQDIATDAFAIITLKKKERGIGNSIQSTGSFIGTLLGSGVLLIIYHYLGWQPLLIALAAFVLIALIPLYFYNPKKNKESSVSKKEISIKEIVYFFTQKGIAKRIITLILFYSGIIGILAMLKPFLVDLGYNTKEIGIMVGIFGTGIGCITAFISSWIIKRFDIKRSSFFVTMLMIVTSSYFFTIANLNTQTWMILIGIALLWGCYGLASVIIFTSSMNAVRKGREGTDFTLQIVLTHISSILMVIICSKIAGAFSYKALFAFEILMGFISICSIYFLYAYKKEKTRKLVAAIINKRN